jgi:hypothetical protein
MKRITAALALLCFVPGLASAQLKITKERASYGPMGATRKDKTFMIGDAVWVNYDIEGLTPDKKTGKVSYETKLEFFDSNKKLIFDKTAPNEALPDLGGGVIPSDFHVIFGQNLGPGKYTVRVTVTDRLAKANTSLDYPVQVVKSEFGFYGVSAPSVGLPGQNYVLAFGLAEFKMDSKGKADGEMTINILDGAGKPVSKAIKMPIPDPSDPKMAFVPFTYPLLLNRPGQFTVEISVVDKLANNKQIQLRYPLTVVDLGSIGSGK